jgi:type IV secretion system protein VirD4
VLSTARRHTKLLDYSAMRSVLSAHDFDLADLKRDPRGVTVYLLRWSRLFGQLPGQIS